METQVETPVPRVITEDEKAELQKLKQLLSGKLPDNLALASGRQTGKAGFQKAMMEFMVRSTVENEIRAKLVQRGLVVGTRNFRRVFKKEAGFEYTGPIRSKAM